MSAVMPRLRVKLNVPCPSHPLNPLLAFPVGIAAEERGAGYVLAEWCCGSRVLGHKTQREKQSDERKKQVFAH